MEPLTITEKKVLNNLSQVRDYDVKLGDKLAEIISLSGEEGTPVNAVAASKILTISGVVIHGETVSIGVDSYEFLTDDAQDTTSPANIPVDISANCVKASGTLTMDTQPTAGDTITIGTRTYIFVPVGTANANGEVSIGTDLSAAKLALVAAINGTDGVNVAHALVSAAAFVADDCVITAFIGGTVGNTIATTETFSAVTNIFAAVVLGSGANCSATNAVAALVEAINTNDEMGVTAVDGDGDTIVLTSDLAGVIGNSITLGKVMANGAFAGNATALSGGVNGTIAGGTKFMMDASYLYVCLDGNFAGDANWRRISLGPAY